MPLPSLTPTGCALWDSFLSLYVGVRQLLHRPCPLVFLGTFFDTWSVLGDLLQTGLDRCLDAEICFDLSSPHPFAQLCWLLCCSSLGGGLLEMSLRANLWKVHMGRCPLAWAWSRAHWEVTLPVPWGPSCTVALRPV
jgi:hypothetical protein